MLGETIELDMDESNTLGFKVKIEGTEAVTNPAKVRLVCESNDVSYMFHGNPTGTDDIVEFTLPSMKDKLKEGAYVARVEVLVENRYFAPVEFNINFKKAIKVFAEAVTRVIAPKQSNDIKVSAAPIQVIKREAPVTVKVPIAVQPKLVATQPVTQTRSVEQKKPVEPVVAEQKQVERECPPPARESAQFTLKERYTERKVPQVKDEDDYIKFLARKFAKSNGK